MSSCKADFVVLHTRARTRTSCRVWFINPFDRASLTGLGKGWRSSAHTNETSNFQFEVLLAEVDVDNRVNARAVRQFINQIFINSIRDPDSFHGKVCDDVDICYL